MLEDKEDNLQNNVGTEETSGSTEEKNNSESETEANSAPSPETIETDSGKTPRKSWKIKVLLSIWKARTKEN